MKWNINKLPARTKDWILTGMFAMIICLLPLIFSSDYCHPYRLYDRHQHPVGAWDALCNWSGRTNQHGPIWILLGIGAYAGALLTTKGGLGFVPSLIVTIAISAAFGMLVGIPALKVEGPYLSLCTIGFAESVRLIINSAGWSNKSNGIMRIPKLEIFGWTMQTKTMSYFFIFVFVLIGLIIVTNFVNSNYGRRFSAIKDDPLAASVMGVNVRKVKIMAFVLCAIFAGVAGCLYANYAGYIHPTTFVQALQTNFLLMIVLGGLGSTWGSVLGATLITVVYEYTRVYAEYQKIAFGVVMILTVLFLQRGIVGTIRYHKQQKMIRDQHAGWKNDGKEAAV